MRVISGTARGRPLKAVPGEGTRPTTDKVKEAVFSILNPYLQGGWVLDLFAGTGGLGIEALSRGMDHAVFIDLERKSVEVIRHNIDTAGFREQAEVYRNEAQRALKALAKREVKFALVFLDPPYRLKTMEELLLKLVGYELLEPEAIIVAEHDRSNRYPETVDGLQQIRRADYGDTAITIYQYRDAPSASV
ncbi:16S rRNA (guanine(966)-N(2))-methyltransferase RsmD [Paenibacillus senegalensis]|uniref:16S rRNA (guanine(966)-N(2))-methyltransferase RsmD n=1 Tax=Paenibacillus senegalensis TaxID=1465766 RepID=UPI00028932B4|nr:16S rRNA (guanine(966)-N(2))-methyltransferase RsmD [Paenibacillus senegalensis]